MESNKKSWFNALFIIVMLVYGFLIFLKANFGVIDDHTLLDTIMQGKFLPLFIIPEIGRFFPLDAFELNIISLISKSPVAFYFYNSIQFFLLVIMLLKILREFRIPINIVYIIIITLIVTPGFVTSWFRLFVPERDVLFFLTLFIYFLLKYQKKQKLLFLVVALISANISLYYKEPVFLMLGTFAFLHIVFGWNKITIKQKLLDILIIFSSAVFVVTYFLLVYTKMAARYGDTNLNTLIVFSKNLFNYLLFDTILIIMIPLVIYRIYIIIKEKNFNEIFDSLLFSSSIYVLVILFLNIPFSYHYLLPVYTFSIISIVYFVFNNKLYEKITFKFLLFLFLFFTTFNSIPQGLYFISYYKNVPNNFQNTLSFLTNYINQNSKNDKKVSIFLYGVNRNSGVEVYHSFIKYLEYNGLTSKQFDLKTEMQDNAILKLRVDKNSHYSLYSVYKYSEPQKIQCNDLIIVSPFTNYYVDLKKQEILNLTQQYELIYKTSSFLEVPNINLKSMVKFLLFKLKTKNKVNGSQIMISENMFGLPMDFYVFKKKCE